jgi:hypothetical protein
MGSHSLKKYAKASVMTAALKTPPELKSDFLIALRQRFKHEVNRLTNGAMAKMLGKETDTEQLSFLLTYVYIYHWLRHNVHSKYFADLLRPFRGSSRAFLMDLLEQSDNDAEFVRGYIDYWQNNPIDPPIQRQLLMQLLDDNGGDKKKLAGLILERWSKLGLFTKDTKIEYRDIAREERNRYSDMLGTEDKARLELIDALPDIDTKNIRFDKLGLIPAMGCPQTCRHCMFIWRPLMKDTPDPEPLFKLVNNLTDNVLFTGGDLTRQLDSFYHAITSMRDIHSFAILLNGDFAESTEETQNVLQKMASAIRRRPINWPRAKVVLQISFDEFHQEIISDKKGNLKERIPVKKIANIVEASPRYPEEIQLCLIHKQTGLNFSMELFQKGVFGRLVTELGRRNHQVQILTASPSNRLKRNPAGSDEPAQVIKDASFVLTRHPDYPILFTSSTIDAYGRASVLDESESVSEKDLLNQALNGETTSEFFDTDLMFWFNGWVTLFSAVHISLGNAYEDGIDTILMRYKKDPLGASLYKFDTLLLDYYQEIRADLNEKIHNATGPQHLFHTLTEEAEVRLHMTKRLLK